MAGSVKDALLRAGLVRPEDTPEALQERAWREKQRRAAEELAERLADTTAPPAWEKPAPGEIVESDPTRGPASEHICIDCGDPFDPTSAEHKPYGKLEQCGPCARGEAPGPTRKRGQMVWTHKTAPALEIEGGPTISPDELAAMRRR
jgi:hypothetical protein